MKCVQKRIPLAIAIFASAILVLLHYPFDGYQTEVWFGGGGSYIVATRPSELPISLWHSRGAVISWLGTLKHLAISLAIIWTAFGLWVWASRKQ